MRVIITGGAAGIGAVIVRRFLDAGASVVVVDADPDALASWTGVAGATAVLVDAADESRVRAELTPILSTWGGVDVLVNGVGVAGPTGLAESIDLGEWQRCLAVNLDGHFIFSRAVIPAMKQQRSGSIISLSSTAGLYGLGLRSPYATAKWGLIGLMKSLAIELGPYGVRANTVCPGSVRGPRLERIMSAEADERGITRDAVEHSYVSGQSIQRLVEPEEIAALVTFLASDAASMITGQAIAVDGHTEAFHIDD